MYFSLDVRRARKGDCMLLHFGTDDDPGLILVDGGPSQVYKPHLRPRLEEIREARGLAANEQLPVDLLMVSHVDDDHIRGLLELSAEEKNLKRDQEPQLLDVLSFWHNSFDAIVDAATVPLTAAMGSHFGAASLAAGSVLSEDDVLEVQCFSEEGDEVVESGLKVLASIEQGYQLREDARYLGWSNQEFDDGLIIAELGGTVLSMGKKLNLTVAGPMESELLKLRSEHNKWVEKMEQEGKPLPEALAAYVDRSVANLSSIVVLAEVEGMTMLLTGDARGDKIIEGLQLTNMLGPETDSTMKVNVLKVPHHGSSANLMLEFFQRIIADHYVFSGNGEHGNPERESLEMVWNARGDAKYTIHLTYPIDELDLEREKDWQKGQSTDRKKKEKDPNKEVRPDWSPEKHSLKSFLKDNPVFAKKIKVVDHVKPHLINLLDNVDF